MPNDKMLRRVLGGLLLAWCVLLIVNIPYQVLHVDEPWLGEQAYNLAHEGVIRSDLFTGLNHWDERILVAYKLFIVLGALSVWLFGWGIVPLRAVSLLFGIVTLLMLGRLMRRSSGPQSSYAAWLLAVLTLLAMPLYFKFINLYRPEVMLAAFGLGSHFLLTHYLESGRTSALVASAMVAGAAVVVHLNGLIFIAAGAVVLACDKRFKSGALFAVVAAVIGLFYFADVIGHWNLWEFQFYNDPALSSHDFAWYAPFERLLNEHKRLFRKPEIIFSSLLFFGAFVYQWIRMKANRRSILTYTLTAIVALGMIGQAKTTPYAIALFPFFAMVIAGTTVHWLRTFRQTARVVSVAGIVLWGMFLVHSLAADLSTAMTKHDSPQANREITSGLAEHSLVLGPLNLVFNEIDHFQLRGLAAAKVIWERDHGTPMPVDELLNYADSLGIRSVVLDWEWVERGNLRNALVGLAVGNFRVTKRTEKPLRLLLERP